MASAPRMTIPTQLVLQALLDQPDQEQYGFAIADASRLRSGTVHPILARLESIGWVQSRWEDIDPRAEGRPARRYYRLSAEGLPRARHAMSVAQTPVRTLRAPNPTAIADHG